MNGPPHLPPVIRRAAERSLGALADGFSAAVGSAAPGRLEALMGSPARWPILEAIFRAMPYQLDAGRSAGVHTGVRWRVTSRHGSQVDVYDLSVQDGRAWVRRGTNGNAPPLTITVDGAEFLRIVGGRSDPVQAYMARRLSMAGDIMVAARLVSLFRIPGSRGPRRPA